MIKFKPTRGRLLIKRIPQPTTTTSGIALPTIAEADKKLQQRVEVVRLGLPKTAKSGFTMDGSPEIPWRIKPGDHVVIQQNIGTEVEVDGEEFEVVGADDVLCVCQ